MFTVVGLPQISYNCGLVVSTTTLNCTGPSSIPGKTKRKSANSSEIVEFLLKTNMPGYASLLGYVSVKTCERKGSISSHCLYGQLLLTRF